MSGGARTLVHMLRHGEVHNPEGILYGRLPGYHLSERGRAQAETVAKTLVDNDIAVVVASPLLRAQETAAPIADAHGVEIVTEDGLIESENRFEGTRFGVGDGALRRPANWPLMRDPFTPSWGEPYLRIAHRMLGAAHRARELALGREAVCVSHQLPIWTLRRYLMGQRLWHDPRRRQCALASLTTLEFTGSELTGLRYSEPAGSSDPTVTGA
ncbi:MAG: histidine phosphatase family protein [Pseudonocardiaceae bacterium]|nr:MAG: histidine phosphatase family protein [Pseudonocardiaceae bacterium]